jgi:hypothetical protein
VEFYLLTSSAKNMKLVVNLNSKVLLVILLLVCPARQEFLISRNMKKQPMLNVAVVAQEGKVGWHTRFMKLSYIRAFSTA